jgi:hypothetical protein
LILGQADDKVGIETVGVLEIMSVFVESITVIAIQSVLCGEPHEAPAILEGVARGDLGETVSNEETFESDILLQG